MRGSTRHFYFSASILEGNQRFSYWYAHPEKGIGMHRSALFLCGAAYALVSASAYEQAVQPSPQPRDVLVDVAPAPSDRYPARWYPAKNDVVYTETITRHLPYIGILVTSSHFVKPRNGAVEAAEQRTHQMRDGLGRRRHEVEMDRLDAHGKSIKAYEVTVHDTVSHCDFRWMEPWVVTLPQFSQPVATATCRPLRERYTLQNVWRDAIVTTTKHRQDPFGDTISQPLRTRMMEGLEAEGTQLTKVLLDRNGARTGSIVTEIWYAPGLDELLSMSQTFTPSEPGTPPSFRLTLIQQQEPDPSLFYPPKGYRIESSAPPSH